MTRYNERGNIFTALMGGLVILGALSFGAYQLLSGPLTAASNMTQNTLAKQNLMTVGRLMILDAGNQSHGGDCDGDGYIEPHPYRSTSGPRPMGGGLVPDDIGVPVLDPWGTPYGYCAWDIGALQGQSECGGGTGRLNGTPDPRTGIPGSQTVMALISAGPDRQFDTTCNNYNNDSTDVIVRASGSDDIIQRFTYMEAASATTSLWFLKSGDPNTAMINKNLAIGSDIMFDAETGSINALAVNASGRVIAEGGIQIPNQGILSECDTAMNVGMLRYNSSSGRIQFCNNTDSWSNVTASANMNWPLHAPTGSASNPSYSFSGLSSSGLFLSAGDAAVLRAPNTRNARLHADGSMIDIDGDDEIAVTSQGTLVFNATGNSNMTALTRGNTDTDFRLVSQGGVQIGDTTTACSGTTAGTLKFIAADKGYYYCDGDEWRPLDSAPDVDIDGEFIVKAGDHHSCYLDQTGDIYCWGANYWYQLGDGTITNKAEPVSLNTSQKWKMVSDGANHTCAINLGDDLYCWGRNNYGQLGDNSTTDRDEPVAVIGGDKWKFVSGGYEHTCGIKQDGSAWCWGRGDSGRLGHGSMGSSITPVAVSGSDTWRDITAGEWHSCGIKTDGSGWCWGNGSHGRRGDGTTSHVSSPVEVSGDYTWKKLRASNAQHTCGIRTNNTMMCWGTNFYGQLGSNPYTDQHTPAEVTGGHSWDIVGVGYEHTCGIRTDGRMYCWGNSGSERLGIGPASPASPIPQPVLGDYSWIAVSSGGWEHTCGVQDDYSVWCWGQQEYGRIGNDSTSVGNVSEPYKVMPKDPITIGTITEGDTETVALLPSGSGYIRCRSWSSNRCHPEYSIDGLDFYGGYEVCQIPEGLPTGAQVSTLCNAMCGGFHNGGMNSGVIQYNRTTFLTFTWSDTSIALETQTCPQNNNINFACSCF